jgi:hypothetical protein
MGTGITGFRLTNQTLGLTPQGINRTRWHVLPLMTGSIMTLVWGDLAILMLLGKMRVLYTERLCPPKIYIFEP